MSEAISDTFPREITEAILCRLSAKSLCRLKSVSKAWYSLISDPDFTNTHFRYHNKPNTRLLIRPVDHSFYSLDISILDKRYTTGKDGKQVSFPSNPLIKWKRILGSCNGLVLALDVYNKLFLMNPTTRELWAVPPNPFKLRGKRNAHRFLKYGFGYVPSTDDYKIVSISLKGISSGGYNVMVVSLYSLRDNSWKKLSNAPYNHCCSYMSVGAALANHNLHWVTLTPFDQCSTIIAFSLEKEEFNNIQVPDSFQNAKVILYKPLVFREKLAIYGRVLRNDYLWVMGEYGVDKSWTMVCCFHGVDGIHVNPVCLVEGSDRDIVLHDSRGDTRVPVYNIIDEERSWIDVENYWGKRQEKGRDNGRFIVEGTYVESLHSPAKYIMTAP